MKLFSLISEDLTHLGSSMGTEYTTTNWTEEMEESVRKAQDATALMDYNEAYYRWVFGPEKDERANAERLATLRHIWFSM